MFGHLIRHDSGESLAEKRRRKVTQVDVIAEAYAHPLVLGILFAAAAAMVAYMQILLPGIRVYGEARWQAEVDSGSIQPKPGGPFAEVSWTYALLISILYVSLVLLGVRWMDRRPPVTVLIFECMAVYNCTQCLLNCYCCIQIFAEVRMLDFSIWGNSCDTSPRFHNLGSLIWLTYHCRQLELMGTAFIVLRKKFERLSFLHLYLRVLNLWGWYFACRVACGGDTYFPAVITSACQTIVYLHFSLSCLGMEKVPLLKKALITEVQILQYVLCAVHNAFAAARGHLPISLAALHMFVIANGLVLFMDFHHHDKDAHDARTNGGSASKKESRVTFSFDSCGWMMVYHFGVAYWISQHILTGITPDNALLEYPPGIGFSGSSGGCLIGCVLACGQSVQAVFEFILLQRPDCIRNPTNMFAAVRKALEHFQYTGAFKALCTRLRVLVTRVSLRPPFIMGEVIDWFPDNATAVQSLCASCHVPLMAGLFPYRIGQRYYYDGMAWPSCWLVSWRGAKRDRVVRVSALSSPMSDIRITSFPYWWAVLPPPERVLRGIFWCGYRDAATWFNSKPDTQIFERCRTRKPLSPKKVGSTNAESIERETWDAARALLRQSPRSLDEQMSIADPTTGESIQDLIDHFQATVEHANRLIWRCATVIVVVIFGAILHLQPVKLF